MIGYASPPAASTSCRPPAIRVIAHIPHGAEIGYAGSMCRWMASGTAPRIAPDVSAVPRYAAAAEGPIEINSYIGAPIVQPDGELFGTVCGFDPHRKPASLAEHRPLLDLLSSVLSAVLESDLRATAIARSSSRSGARPRSTR